LSLVQLCLLPTRTTLYPTLPLQSYTMPPRAKPKPLLTITTSLSDTTIQPEGGPDPRKGGSDISDIWAFDHFQFFRIALPPNAPATQLNEWVMKIVQANTMDDEREWFRYLKFDLTLDAAGRITGIGVHETYETDPPNTIQLIEVFEKPSYVEDHIGNEIRVDYPHTVFMRQLLRKETQRALLAGTKGNINKFYRNVATLLEDLNVIRTNSPAMVYSLMQERITDTEYLEYVKIE
jgi:hypothetical protein